LLFVDLNQLDGAVYRWQNLLLGLRSPGLRGWWAGEYWMQHSLYTVLEVGSRLGTVAGGGRWANFSVGVLRGQGQKVEDIYHS
jgi:hypothetical protein